VVGFIHSTINFSGSFFMFFHFLPSISEMVCKSIALVTANISRWHVVVPYPISWDRHICKFQGIFYDVRIGSIRSCMGWYKKEKNYTPPRGMYTFFTPSKNMPEIVSAPPSLAYFIVYTLPLRYTNARKTRYICCRWTSQYYYIWIQFMNTYTYTHTHTHTHPHTHTSMARNWSTSIILKHLGVCPFNILNIILSVHGSDCYSINVAFVVRGHFRSVWPQWLLQLSTKSSDQSNLLTSQVFDRFKGAS